MQAGLALEQLKLKALNDDPYLEKGTIWDLVLRCLLRILLKQLNLQIIFFC